MNDSNNSEEQWGIEWWYNAHFLYGVIQTVFIPILVPTYVREMTGSATNAGIAMAIIGCGGLAAPVIGGFADKLRAHRWAQLMGILSYVLATVVFAFSRQMFALHILGSALFGIGSATLLMINPTFIVAAGFKQDDEAKRLTRLNQTVFIGSLLAGLVLSQLTELGLSFQARFLVAAGLSVLSLVLTFLTNGTAAGRIKIGEASDDQTAVSTPRFSEIIFSSFGLLLLAVFLVTTGHGIITTQYPNYMKDVFSIEQSYSSVALSVAALITLIVLGPIGSWMGKSGPNPVWLTAVGMKFVMMILLSIFATISLNISLLPLACYVIFLQGVAMVDMVQPALAVRFSKAGAGLTQGILMFAIASAYAAGSVTAGAAADSSWGYSSLAWMVAIMCFFALVVGFFLFKGENQKQS